ncbi:acyl carrier protein [Paenibacillus sp. 1001270B_150601_E10]|uniref:acyl carrier protein n=1 Tax=Paenibacillus sp. 1001270B_150601_E10 TaxID=2787079 RepID=UPI00189C90DB|nr:phosphopantetheine-binding protein [Paenibacillus sp. 1001270B_150601_E10]
MDPTTVEKLKQIIASCKKQVVEANIHQDADLMRDFGFDSMNFIHLVTEVEMEFDIEIAESEIDLAKLSSFSRLLEMIEGKIAVKADS